MLVSERKTFTPGIGSLVTLSSTCPEMEKDFFTDDASVAEYAGVSINLIQGSYTNIKITTENKKFSLIFTRYS